MSNLMDFIGGSGGGVTISATAGEALLKGDIVKISPVGNAVKEATVTTETLQYKAQVVKDVANGAVGDFTILYTSPIKSIQRGSWSFGSAGSISITINKVDIEKSILNVNAQPSRDFSRTYQNSFSAGGHITNSTTVAFTSGFGDNLRPGILYWEVIEYV